MHYSLLLVYGLNIFFRIGTFTWNSKINWCFQGTKTCEIIELNCFTTDLIVNNRGKVAVFLKYLSDSLKLV